MKLCCWWCTLDIEGTPLELPYKVEKNGKFKTLGNFCSWECIKTYNIQENKLRFGDIQGNITLMRKKMYGKITSLGCAPSRYLLEKFGGTMTEKEFKASFGSRPPQIVMPSTERFLHKAPGIDKKYVMKKNDKNEAQEKLSMIQTSQTKTETLRLKRPIPIKRETNNLETALGIIRKIKK